MSLYFYNYLFLIKCFLSAQNYTIFQKKVCLTKKIVFLYFAFVAVEMTGKIQTVTFCHTFNKTKPAQICNRFKKGDYKSNFSFIIVDNFLDFFIHKTKNIYNFAVRN